MASDIDYQIDLFEIRQSFKHKKHSKQNSKKTRCPLSVKNLRSQSTLVKINCKNDKKTPKAERKPFRYDRYRVEPEFFECDEKFQTKPTDAPLNSLSKQLEEEQLENFDSFRRHFYGVNHQRMKSSFKDCPNVQITDIRLAAVNESVQQTFMQRLSAERSFFPRLVYHGTQLKNIEGILRYGFLIPNQPHPTDDNAPIIKSTHGQAYGQGIYCSQTATYSLSYLSTTNTLLICAALPKHDKAGKAGIFHRNIIVLQHVSRIIPLFFIDFKYLNQSSINHPLFYQTTQSETNENVKVTQPAVISRKYLRKVLSFINDQQRKANQYQMRRFEPFS